MINLEKFLKVDKDTQRFELPLTLFESLKFIFIKAFLENLPLKNKIYFDSKIGSWYWEIIYSYLNKKFGVKINGGFRYFENSPIIFQGNVFHEEGEVKSRGHGNSLISQEEAVSKAIGEYLEREAASKIGDVHEKDLKNKSVLELEKTTKLISDFHTFSDTQKSINKLLNFDKSKKIQTLLVEDLLNNKKLDYPIQNIFLNGRFFFEKEGAIAEITTSGCGGGFTIEMASLSALYEGVERDSFFCYWLTKNIPRQIKISEGEILEYDKLKQILNKSNHELYILDIMTNIGIPSICCVVKNLKNDGICLSGGTDLSYEKAVKKAVLEMYSCLGNYPLEEKMEIDEVNYLPFSDKKIGREERLRFWRQGQYYKHFEFFLSKEGKEEVNLSILCQDFVIFKDEKKELDCLLNKFKNLGNNYDNVYRFNFRQDYLEKLGYFVVRIIIPKLYQLYLNERYALTKSSRLEEFNQYKKGVKDFEINIYPHPFP